MSDYGWYHPFPTRWNDNDVYGHVNNVVYYAAMDTAVNSWMIARGGFDPERGEVIGVIVASSCDYRASGSFPEVLRVGVRAGRVGRTSVTWETGIFREADGELLAAGTFVHVFVDRDDRRPTPIPDALRAAIENELVVTET
ncbi:acyl-CoA thioesterase [Protaetiibacter mangrovi]|uniref:Acyl-CoA thioesterase n=1 Tax=Protaetiibacter mangrovi TaxID=2970926 RepID=A0ABT1ZFQ3_9MICO|nr:thioesterase family protein [Protaetiibacter mangrovi]MCS0499544.1 acyl-CoA thioesterase [Protaetiibacter mangrovi]